MKSETALVATQLRYQQWMDDIRDCKARPAGVTVADWCAEHHITRETYYYRMRVLREACLDYTSIQSMSDTEEQAVAEKSVKFIRRKKWLRYHSHPAAYARGR